MLMIVSRAQIESEVIIDFAQAFRHPDYAKYKPQIGLEGATKADERELYEDWCAVDSNQCLKRSHNRLFDDTRYDKLQMDRFLDVESHGMFLESRDVSHVLTDDQLILLPYRVHGFSLRSRRWGMFTVAIIEGSVILTCGYSLIRHRSSPRDQG